MLWGFLINPWPLHVSFVLKFTSFLPSFLSTYHRHMEPRALMGTWQFSKLTFVLCLASINMCASNGRCDGCIAKHIHPLIHGQAQATRGSKGDLASSASHTWIKSKIEKYTSLKLCIHYLWNEIVTLYLHTRSATSSPYLAWQNLRFDIKESSHFLITSMYSDYVLCWALVVWIDSVSITQNW